MQCAAAHQPKRITRQIAEEDVLRDRAIRHQAQLLVDHHDALVERVARATWGERVAVE